MRISLNWISDYVDIEGVDLEFLIVELNKKSAKVKDITRLSEDIIIHFSDMDIIDRPELWSHYGIAKAISIITGRELKSIEYVNEGYLKYVSSDMLSSHAKQEKNCLRCSAIKIENVTTEISPDFIINRLINCGIEPVNLAVDLANYVLLDIGQPVNIFIYPSGNLIAEASVFDGDSMDVSMTSIAVCRYVRLVQEYMPEARTASALYDRGINSSRTINIQPQYKYITL